MTVISEPFLMDHVDIHSDNFGDDGLLRAGLKLNHLRMIVAIEDSGQISAAAEVLNISQPAASRMLSEMESITKTSLYERVARGVVLTTFGAALARRARKILLELREASREIGELKSGKGGSVFIGAVTAPAMSLVVPAINKVRKAYPGIEINIQVETSNVLARELLAARHDFIIGRIPDDLNPRLFEVTEIGIERACLIVRSRHPLMKQKTSSLSDVRDYDWVFQPPGTLLRRTIEDVFLSHGVALPENIVNTSSLLLTCAIICETDAIAPVAVDVAQFLASQGSNASDVRMLPIDFDINVKPYSMITARERALPPSARLLYDIILEESHKQAG
ncbi:LysR family transcriptional regulator [Rhizobium ruizarguesonis]|jgi:DNA-binding transcriptional LysR family regulator|uniref:LysR family transcriptional regulator n=1 Tax=Rhizobium ruizarguesonis TaxID=2081791 RepID=UPI0003A21EB3|nr:LysR family transcriptional regulator [Rhizobium ruizarguesonis]MBY5850336.1 LysR family transcriptional regulator [Rhizobium leguminosarum]NKK55081.1 LysR family transcriptional regulator [Rhizobium leguminosarum bv. viciae]MBY5885586.1 LysR family transcriptional regulator [Rhizobium leguminosarum]NEH76618.1 LysR family transcriptional regulator [Rhizobium ruizarguesonis]NEI75771.1 LysR family transcriptional regulator [Rhizobium ruizarguesonis]